MIGTRLKLIRQAQALSLQDLSDLLAESELPIKRAALSHYEMGVTVPNGAALEILGRKLGVSAEFFLRPDWENIAFHLFYEPDFSQKQATTFFSYLQIELEKLVRVDDLLQICQPFVPPARTKIPRGKEAAVEEIARNIRQAYGLGSAPISSVSTILENNRWRLIEYPGDIPFCSGYESSRDLGFIIYPSLFTIDDFRAALLKALGYAFFCGEDAAHTQQLAEHFSRAMLLPPEAAEQEFGRERENIYIAELTLVKQKYGISKRSIIFRLAELGIVTQEYCSAFEDLMRLHGYPQRKRILDEQLLFFENPTQAANRILQAQSRGLLSQEHADELLLLKHML